jgi:hypothetical protein
VILVDMPQKNIASAIFTLTVNILSKLNQQNRIRGYLLWPGQSVWLCHPWYTFE